MIKAAVICAIGYAVGYFVHYRKVANELEALRIRFERELKYWQAKNGHKADGR